MSAALVNWAAEFWVEHPELITHFVGSDFTELALAYQADIVINYPSAEITLVDETGAAFDESTRGFSQLYLRIEFSDPDEEALFILEWL